MTFLNTVLIVATSAIVSGRTLSIITVAGRLLRLLTDTHQATVQNCNGSHAVLSARHIAPAAAGHLRLWQISDQGTVYSCSD